jgi:hypothetical protein
VLRRARAKSKKPLILFTYLICGLLVFIDALSWFSAIPTANAAITN